MDVPFFVPFLSLSVSSLTSQTCSSPNLSFPIFNSNSLLCKPACHITMVLSTGSVGSTFTLSLPIPLTTAFVPASSCLSNVYQYFPDPSNTLEYYLQLGAEDQKNKCLPPGWAATSQYFSPAVCPTGYSQACWVTSSLGANSETLATCCPSGFTCATLPGVSYPTWLPSLYSTQVCVGSGGQGSSIGTFAVTKVTDGTTVVSNPVLLGGVNAYGVSIRFKAEATAPTTGGSHSATGNPSATTTSAGASSPSTWMPNTESGLSTSAKAGIGAGAGAVGVTLLAFLACFALRRRKRATVHVDEIQQYPDQPTMYGSGSGPSPEFSESKTINPEMGVGNEVGELPGHGIQAKRAARGDVHELG
ncbi:hypothetical protein ONS95_011036 [Cadophora gregata]|uniref:uncharacterized protein n=1 Tax=Cadophora gregata TaxID=51156 RepID=UPI0026DB9CAD|nr:uncharacterized protein ONS95_011036 [Cadophora gregata]KAK0119596.1 hypothetical protein ONS95_011036 [Cadophora gregata]KAK0120632.1 hypothetical protein ONS96_010836 [Cadophora gregata f. sp. sojae]